MWFMCCSVIPSTNWSIIAVYGRPHDKLNIQAIYAHFLNMFFLQTSHKKQTSAVWIVKNLKAHLQIV